MKIKFIIFFGFISFSLFSQGVNNLWLMGYESWAGRPYGGSNLNFTGGVMDTSYQSRIMNFDATNGVICDKNGNLLFSSNGIFVANAYNDTMQNGSGLNPAYFTTSQDSFGLLIPQANLVIPFPDDSTKYYLFHETDDDYGNTFCTLHLYNSIIDMTQDSGKGAVIEKNLVLLNDSLVPGRITACKHANGRDWWVVTHQYNTNEYYKYLISPFGIQGPYTQNIGSLRGIGVGQLVFSPDGSKAAYYDITNSLDLMDFDRCTGDFNNLVHVDINDSAAGGGAAFSPDSKVLYISSMNYVYQFDLTASNIPSTQTTVAIYDGYFSPKPPLAANFYLSQLAPDGKIYINCGNGTIDIHVINNPDSLGLACDICQHCVHLPAFNSETIPNHPNYFLGAESGSVCDSLTNITQKFSKGESVLKMFPNPVVDGNEVTFNYNVSSMAGIISIYNMEGEEVAHYSLPQWSSVQHLKLPEISSGIYIARITKSNQTVAVKFVKE